MQNIDLPVVFANARLANEGQLCSHPTQILLDTGSMIGAISARHPLSQFGKNQNKNITLKGFSENVKDATEMITVDILIEDPKTGQTIVPLIQICIIKDLSFEMILPYSIISDFKLQFSPRYCYLRNLWNKDSFTLRLLTNDIIRINSAKVIEPFAEISLPYSAPTENPKTICLVGKYKDSLDLPCITKNDSVTIIHPSMTPIKLRTGNMLCTASPNTFHENKHYKIKEFNNKPHLRKSQKLIPLDMGKFQLEHLSPTLTKIVKQIIKKFSHVFARSNLDIGPGFRHPIPYQINRTVDSPQPRKYIPVAEAHKEFLQKHIESLEAQGVVERVKNL